VGATRRLAAIVFTDIVGYTALTQADEALAMEVLARHNQLLRPFFPKFNGKEIKAIGDSFLVEFESALDAIRCATEIQSFLHDYNISSREDWKIKLRIGIHLGDVIHKEGDVFGDAVNIASRIEPIAFPEGICVSQQVYDQVQNKLRAPLVSLGEKSLKNVSLPVAVYKVVMPWEQENPETATQLDARRLAVLPFVSMSPDPNDEFFADGLTEELIARISLVRGLEVIARTSAMNYKKKEKNASQIGKELKVGTLLEGSVRKAGNRIRVSAQLIDARTEGHLWAQHYDRELQDIFEVQSSVAESVAEALKLRILDEVSRKVGSTDNIDAYTLYLKGMQVTHERWGEASCREAIALFEAALSKDPSFARAYAGLSNAWIQMANWTDFSASVNKAEAAALKALELGPESAETHIAMAQVHFEMDRFEDADLEAEKAIRINPNLADAIFQLGEGCARRGRFDKAIEYYRKACSLDPLDGSKTLSFAAVLRRAGRVNEALAVVEERKEGHPTEDWVYFQPAMCYLQMKDFAKTLAVLDVGLRNCTDVLWLRLLQGVVWAVTGKRKEAMDVLQDLMKDEAESHRLRAQVWIGTAVGDLDGAFRALMRQAELHSWSDPREQLFEALRKDPRYPEFCKKVGLPL
jgi:adenylate cyclase